MLAHIEQQRLEDAGINCFIADELITTVNPFYNTAVGGIKLKVFQRDIETCEGILGVNEADAIERMAELTPDQSVPNAICPNCGSDNTRYGNATEKPHSWYGILFAVIMSSIAVGVMPMFSRKAWHCFNCSKDFKQ